ncbi:MAG: hypothetical protein HC933_03775 [Pleurocapsa sp. SU_196_0]|nr:hypothetical protein [Pleurocapsa sp. SU_196_0]
MSSVSGSTAFPSSSRVKKEYPSRISIGNTRNNTIHTMPGPAVEKARDSSCAGVNTSPPTASARGFERGFLAGTLMGTSGSGESGIGNRESGYGL